MLTIMPQRDFGGPASARIRVRVKAWKHRPDTRPNQTEPADWQREYNEQVRRVWAAQPQWIVNPIHWPYPAGWRYGAMEGRANDITPNWAKPISTC